MKTGIAVFKTGPPDRCILISVYITCTSVSIYIFAVAYEPEDETFIKGHEKPGYWYETLSMILWLGMCEEKEL